MDANGRLDGIPRQQMDRRATQFPKPENIVSTTTAPFGPTTSGQKSVTDTKFVIWTSTDPGDTVIWTASEPFTETIPVKAIESSSSTSTPSSSPSSTATETNTSSSKPTSKSATGTTRHPKHTNPPSQPTVDNSSSGISSGAAAGIGIGCAIAGAAIAAIVFLILFRKRSRKPSTSRGSGAYSGAAYGEKGDSKGVPLTDISPIGSSALIEDHLPQPVEDGALSGELSKINSLIKNHVSSYYDLTGAKKAPALSAFGNNTPIHPEVLAGHLTNPTTRAAALRFCIAWTLFGRAANGSDELSLIPGSLAASQGSMSGLRGKNEARQALLGRWRAIAGALWESDTARDAPSKQALLDALEDLVEPFAAKSSMERERVQNLEVVISRAQNLAFLVFRQPSLFSYDWDKPSNGTAVLFPGMLQVTDEKGQWLRPSREVARKTVDSQLK